VAKYLLAGGQAITYWAARRRPRQEAARRQAPVEWVAARQAQGSRTAADRPRQLARPPSVFPSGRNVLDLEPILGLQLPDRVGHCGLILFGVGKRQVRTIDLGRTPTLQ